MKLLVKFSAHTLVKTRSIISNIRDLLILGRERLQVRDFLTEQHRARASQCHFGGKNVTLSSF